MVFLFPYLLQENIIIYDHINNTIISHSHHISFLQKLYIKLFTLKTLNYFLVSTKLGCYWNRSL